jgi:hypothetical protein
LIQFARAPGGQLRQPGQLLHHAWRERQAQRTEVEDQLGGGGHEQRGRHQDEAQEA